MSSVHLLSFLKVKYNEIYNSLEYGETAFTSTIHLERKALI